MIALGQVLEQMEAIDRKGNAVPFDVKFVTANEKTGEGGDIKHYPFAVMLTNRSNRVNASDKPKAIAHRRKKANHWENATRNIQLLGSGKIKKIHIWLITEFNGEKVVWNILG
jgi:hypothetical protein